MDIEGLKQIWPRIPKKSEKALREGFKAAKLIKMDLECEDPIINVNTAHSTCSQRAIYTQDNNRQSTQAVTVVYQLEKINGVWQIVGQH
jgi:hypothetical protein